MEQRMVKEKVGKRDRLKQSRRGCVRREYAALSFVQRHLCRVQHKCSAACDCASVVLIRPCTHRRYRGAGNRRKEEIEAALPATEAPEL